LKEARVVARHFIKQGLIWPRAVPLVLLAALIVAVLVLPVIVERQVASLLREYGVQDYSYKELRVSSNSLAAGGLRFRGERDGLLFEAEIEAVELGWNWSALLDGSLERVRMQRLALLLEQGPANGESAPAVIQLAGLLPRSAIERLPVGSLQVGHLSLEYREFEGESLRADGFLEIRDEARLELHTSLLAADVHLVLTVPATGPALSLETAASASVGELFNFSADLDASSSGTWQWRGGGTVHFAPLLDVLRAQYPPAPGDTLSLGAVDLRGRMNVDVRLQHPDRIDQPVGDITAWLREQQGRARLQGAVDRLDYANALREVQGSFALSGEFGRKSWAIDVESADFSASVASEILNLPAESIDWLSVEGRVPLRIAFTEGFRLQTANPDRWELELDSGRLTLGTRENQLRLHGLDVSSQIESQTPDLVELSLASRLDARLRERALPSLAISLTHAGSSSLSHFELGVRDVAESMRVQVAGDIDPGTGAGAGVLSFAAPDLPAAASTVLPLLARFHLFDEDIEVTAGGVSLESRFTSEAYRLEGLRQETTLSLQGVSGRFEDYRFADLSLDADWQGAERWQTSRPVRLSLGRLDLGFELSDLKATAQVLRLNVTEPPIVRLESFSSGVFGGRLFLPEPALWDFGAEDNRFSLEAQNWQLAQLVALQQGQKIEATGLLEGRLPVELTGGRVVIEKGSLRSIPPGGTIRYVANESSRALASSSAELALALDLLEDFRFQVLSTEVRLDREGQLWLGLSLEGKNPARYGGRAVNFNINLEQNLDPLLQSLRLSDKLVEKLEKDLK
jgi:hypothetical protein